MCVSFFHRVNHFGVAHSGATTVVSVTFLFLTMELLAMVMYLKLELCQSTRYDDLILIQRWTRWSHGCNRDAALSTGER